MQFQPTEPQDDRLLVIEVTKEDINNQKDEQRQGSLTDTTLFNILNTLLQNPQNQRRAIGLDIHRDFKTKNQALSNLLAKNPLIFGVCYVGDFSQNNPGVAPPAEIPTERLGFSDFLSDSDGLVRRQVLSIDTPENSLCWSSDKKPVINSFSLELAQHYLGKQYEEINNRSIDLRLGDTTFESLYGSYRGGYSFWTDLSGYQLLLHYRRSCSEKDKTRCSPEFIAKRVTVAQVLQPDFLQRYSLKDKIVLIGVSDSSYETPWDTPFSSGDHLQISGVIIQAQMVSQIVSAVLDKRPLLRVLSIWYDLLWILFWSLVGGFLVRFIHQPRKLIVFGGVAFISLYVVCLTFFITPIKFWIPFVPPALSLLSTGGVVVFIKFKAQKSSVLSPINFRLFIGVAIAAIVLAVLAFISYYSQSRIKQGVDVLLNPVSGRGKAGGGR